MRRAVVLATNELSKRGVSFYSLESVWLRCCSQACLRTAVASAVGLVVRIVGLAVWTLMHYALRNTLHVSSFLLFQDSRGTPAPFEGS